MLAARWLLAGVLSVSPMSLAGDVPSSEADEGQQTPQKVCFNAIDGYFIHADYYGPLSGYEPAPIVILVPDCPGERKDWAALIGPLREAGFVVLAPDLRGLGESANSETQPRAAGGDAQLLADMQKDLRGAYDWLAQQAGVDRARVAMVAAGVGSGVALRYAAKDRSVDAIVCLSPRLSTAGINPLGDMGQIRGRTILLVGAEGERGDCQKLAARGERVNTEIVSASATGTRLLEAVPDLRRRIVGALVRGVGSPSERVVFGSLESNVYHLAGSGWIARINTSNLRCYSSPEEAEARGLRAAKSGGPSGRTERLRPREQP